MWSSPRTRQQHPTALKRLYGFLAQGNQLPPYPTTLLTDRVIAKRALRAVAAHSLLNRVLRYCTRHWCASACCMLPATRSAWSRTERCAPLPVHKAAKPSRCAELVHRGTRCDGPSTCDITSDRPVGLLFYHYTVSPDDLYESIPARPIANRPRARSALHRRHVQTSSRPETGRLRCG